MPKHVLAFLVLTLCPWPPLASPLFAQIATLHATGDISSAEDILDQQIGRDRTTIAFAGIAGVTIGPGQVDSRFLSQGVVFEGVEGEAQVGGIPAYLTLSLFPHIQPTSRVRIRFTRPGTTAPTTVTRFGVITDSPDLNRNCMTFYGQSSVPLGSTCALSPPPVPPSTVEFFGGASATGIAFVDLYTDGVPFEVVNLSLTSACDASTTPCITGPNEGSHPRSRFVVLRGTGQADAMINLLSDNSVIGSTAIDSDGQWEAVIEPGSGQHGLNAQYAGAQGRSNTVTVTMGYQSPPTRLADTTPFLSLRKADILVTSSPESPQKRWYGPNWTHAALYLGGDQDGTPLIAEAVTAGESFGFSQVRALPLDVSTVYQVYPTRVEVFRPIDELSRVQRDSIVSWAQVTAARGLQYWDLPTDFLPIGGAWLLWQERRVSPRFETYMARVRSNTWSANKFICSTLVWRAYLEGTGGVLDFLQGNLMSAAPGSYLEPMSDPAFFTRLGQNFLVPETFVRSAKLRPVR